jgi:hypothetical protein
MQVASKALSTDYMALYPRRQNSSRYCLPLQVYMADNIGIFIWKNLKSHKICLAKGYKRSWAHGEF